MRIINLNEGDRVAGVATITAEDAALEGPLGDQEQAPADRRLTGLLDQVSRLRGG